MFDKENIKNNLYFLSRYLCNEFINVIPSHRIRIWAYKKIGHLKIGNYSSIGMHAILNASYGIRIGNNCAIAQYVYLDGRGELTIGNNVNISRGTSIYTAYHNPTSSQWEYIERSVVIDEDVWVASNSVIIQGVHIGRGAVVAAGSVVVKDVKPYEIVGGNPAMKIGKRSTKLNYLTEYFELFY